MDTKEQNHAIENARGWLASIREMVAALSPEECPACGRWHADPVEASDEDDTTEGGSLPRSKACDDEAAGDTEDEARETAEERIRESALSVQVRGGWRDPGAESDGPEEAEILLTTGGPALRLMVELDEHAQPHRCYLQWQDWGTPWTDHVELGVRDDLMAFAARFYFGD